MPIHSQLVPAWASYTQRVCRELSREVMPVSGRRPSVKGVVQTSGRICDGARRCRGVEGVQEQGSADSGSLVRGLFTSPMDGEAVGERSG